MRRRILLVSGSTRAASSNTLALQAASESLATSADIVLYADLAKLPAFNPDDDYEPLPPAVAALREQIAKADVVIFCTPEYAGTLPGAFKNLLDWTVGGGEIYGKPASWINVAAPNRGGGADATLRTVLGYVGAEILPASGARVPMAGDGRSIGEPHVREELASVLDAILAEADAITSASPRRLND